MADISEWHAALNEALNQRAAWLTSSEIPKLREELRRFQTAYSTMYNVLLKKGVLTEDPYKSESKVTDLVMPETGPFTENNKHDQFSLRLANYDNQLDYVINFYTYSLETLSQDKIKILLAVLKFIDWLHPTPDSQSVNTQAMAAIITEERRNPSDPVSTRNFTESLRRLESSTKDVTNLLKSFSDYNREAYKAEVRATVTGAMPPDTVNAVNVKKKFSQVLPGKPFYTELIEELINEDYSQDAPNLQKKLLAKLAFEDAKAAESKNKPASYKPLLIEGLNAAGSAGATLEEIVTKIDSNHEVHQSRKKTFGEKIKLVLAKVFNKEPDSVIYICESIDPDKGPVRDKIDYQQFRDDIARKSKILLAVAAKGTAAAKLESMQETQLIELLDRNIRDLQVFHRQLDALDDFFKTEVDPEDRARIKGIKPELSTIKNAVAKATSKKHDFMAVREEVEQFKKLGIET